MRLSSRGEYGLLALVHIALHSVSGPVQSQQVAKEQGIPKQYLDQLMMALRAAGFVVSARGRQGGYSLARPARDITLLDVVTALEGPVRNLNFLPKGRRRFTARGVLKGVWDDLWSRSIASLRAQTLEEICNSCRSEEQALTYDI
jgi:Rrf2 family cysteine metabolism transcriptional repressor